MTSYVSSYNPDVICYKRGEKGHKSNSPLCEKNRKGGKDRKSVKALNTFIANIEKAKEDAGVTATEKSDKDN